VKRLCYFAVGTQGQLVRVSHTALARLWRGRLRADALGCHPGRELRLLSVVCDDLRPVRAYLLRLPLTAGQFTLEDYLTLRLFTLPDCVTEQENARHHGQGWPADLLRQLAVALDVPVADLPLPLKVGGPLFDAVARGATPPEASRRPR
jgi:hypothetical protein